MKIGRLAVALALDGSNDSILSEARRQGFTVAVGRVGSMNVEKVVAAIETAAKREGVIGGGYRGEHALYHATLEALQGACRGNLALGSILRTAGLSFAVVKGVKDDQGEWIAVAVYGTMGAPIKGFEHEVIGLGLNHY